MEIESFMAYVAVDGNGDEWQYVNKPKRDEENKVWIGEWRQYARLDNGTIKKIIGREMTWDDEPIELNEDSYTKISHVENKNFLAYVTVNEDGDEYLYGSKPERDQEYKIWLGEWERNMKLEDGTIKKIIGREMTWDDEPIGLNEDLYTKILHIIHINHKEQVDKWI